MNGHREAKILLLPIKVIEMIAPQILHIAGIHPAVRVRRVLDEHHRRQVVEIPIRGDFDEGALRTGLQGVHPVRGVFGVVDWGPGVADAEVVGVAVFVGEGVIWLCSAFRTCRQRGREKEVGMGSFEPNEPYSMPYFSISSAPSLDDSHQGATLPRGGLPQKSVSIFQVLSRMACCCSMVILVGFSWE